MRAIEWGNRGRAESVTTIDSSLESWTIRGELVINEPVILQAGDGDARIAKIRAVCDVNTCENEEGKVR